MRKSYSYAPKPFRKMPKGTKKLAVNNAIYVPDTNASGKKISEREFRKRIKEVENFLIEMFGGYTTDEMEHGEYLSRIKKKIVSERIARILCFTDVKTFRKQREKLEKWPMKKKMEWKQESIAYEFEGDLFYI